MKDRIVLICDSDEKVIQELKEGLTQSDFPVETATDATGIVSRALAHPTILLINPDMKGFNANDICKKLKKEGNTPVVFLIDAHSTTRAQYADCEADDLVTKPVEIGNLITLLTKHYTVTSNTK